MAKKKIYKHHERTTIAAAITDSQQRELVLGNSEKQAAIRFNDNGIVSFPGYIEVTAYGATGDGSTNDTAAIRTALAAAQSLGRDLYFPKGTYKINAPLATPINFDTDAPDVTIIMEKGASFIGTVVYSYLYFKKFKGDRALIFQELITTEISAPVDGLYPEWWGCKADGSTDNATLIGGVIGGAPNNTYGSTIHFGSGTYYFGSSTTIGTTRTLTLKCDAGTRISGASGSTFTFKGSLEAPLSQLFVSPSYNGITGLIVSLNVRSPIALEWFGLGGAFITNDAPALQAALRAASATTGGVVELPTNQIVYVGSLITIPTGVTLRGRGRGSGKITCSSVSANLFEIVTGADVQIRNIDITHYDISLSASAIRIYDLGSGGPVRTLIEGVKISNFQIGVDCAATNTYTTILDCYISTCTTGIKLDNTTSAHISRVVFDACITKDITLSATVSKTLLMDIRSTSATLNFTDSANDTQWITEERLKFYRSIGFFGTTPQSQQSGIADPRTVLRTYGLMASTTQTLATPAVLLTQIADQTTANTTTESALSGSVTGSSVIRTGTFRVGLTLRTHIRGYLTTTGTPTIRLKQKLGGIIVFDTGAVTMATVASATEFEFFITTTIRSIGASGTSRSQGYFRYGNTIVSGPAQTADVTTDTTADRIISPSIQWGTANASNTITVTNMVHELLN